MVESHNTKLVSRLQAAFASVRLNTPIKEDKIMAFTCKDKKHEGSEQVLDYLPHMGWFCELCEKADGNVTLNGYAPEKKVVRCDTPRHKPTLIAEVIDNMSAQEIADLLVRRVFTNLENTEDSQGRKNAHLRYVKTVTTMDTLLEKAYNKIDQGVGKRRAEELEEKWYNKGWNDYMFAHDPAGEARYTLSSESEEIQKAYQDGWDDAVAEIEFGTKPIARRAE